jgi:hypothetical protein
MANEQDNSSMDNFSIQDTMQMGMGNTCFRWSLDDLLVQMQLH